MRKLLFAVLLAGFVFAQATPGGTDSRILVRMPADQQTYYSSNGVLDLIVEVSDFWGGSSGPSPLHCEYSLMVPDSASPVTGAFDVRFVPPGPNTFTQARALHGLKTGWHTLTVTCTRGPTDLIGSILNAIPFIGHLLVNAPSASDSSSFNHVLSAKGCIDSDGDDPFTVGTCTESLADVVANNVIRTDYCSDERTLHEYVCPSDAVAPSCQEKLYPCEYGCFNGACLRQAEVQTKCTDIIISGEPTSTATEAPPVGGGNDIATMVLMTGESFSFHGKNFTVYQQSLSDAKAWVRDSEGLSASVKAGGNYAVFKYDGFEIQVKLVSQSVNSDYTLNANLEFVYVSKGGTPSATAPAQSGRVRTVCITIDQPRNGSVYSSRIIPLQYKLHSPESAVSTPVPQPTPGATAQAAPLRRLSFATVTAPPGCVLDRNSKSGECGDCAVKHDYVFCCSSMTNPRWGVCSFYITCGSGSRCYYCDGDFNYCYYEGGHEDYKSCSQQGYPLGVCRTSPPSGYSLCSDAPLPCGQGAYCYCPVVGGTPSPVSPTANATSIPPTPSVTSIPPQEWWDCAYSVDGGAKVELGQVAFGSTQAASFTVPNYGDHDVQVFCNPVVDLLPTQQKPLWLVESQVINFSVKQPDFVVTLYEPENKTYWADDVPWAFEISYVSETIAMEGPTDYFECEGMLDGAWGKIALDPASAVSTDLGLFPEGERITGYFKGLPYSGHTAQVRCKSTFRGDTAYSNQQNFTNREPDKPEILYPENKTYWADALDLSFIIDGNYDYYSCQYALDNSDYEDFPASCGACEASMNCADPAVKQPGYFATGYLCDLNGKGCGGVCFARGCGSCPTGQYCAPAGALTPEYAPTGAKCDLAVAHDIETGAISGDCGGVCFQLPHPLHSSAPTEKPRKPVSENLVPAGQVVSYRELLKFDRADADKAHNVSVRCRGVNPASETVPPYKSDSVAFTVLEPGKPAIYSPANGSAWYYDANCSNAASVPVSWAVGGYSGSSSIGASNATAYFNCSYQLNGVTHSLGTVEGAKDPQFSLSLGKGDYALNITCRLVPDWDDYNPSMTVGDSLNASNGVSVKLIEISSFGYGTQQKPKATFKLFDEGGVELATTILGASEEYNDNGVCLFVDDVTCGVSGLCDASAFIKAGSCSSTQLPKTSETVYFSVEKSVPSVNAPAIAVPEPRVYYDVTALDLAFSVQGSYARYGCRRTLSPGSTADLGLVNNGVLTTFANNLNGLQIGMDYSVLVECFGYCEATGAYSNVSNSSSVAFSVRTQGGGQPTPTPTLQPSGTPYPSGGPPGGGGGGENIYTNWGSGFRGTGRVTPSVPALPSPKPSAAPTKSGAKGDSYMNMDCPTTVVNGTNQMGAYMVVQGQAKCDDSLSVTVTVNGTVTPGAGRLDSCSGPGSHKISFNAAQWGSYVIEASSPAYGLSGKCSFKDGGLATEELPDSALLVTLLAALAAAYAINKRR